MNCRSEDVGSCGADDWGLFRLIIERRESDAMGTRTQLRVLGYLVPIVSFHRKDVVSFIDESPADIASFVLRCRVLIHHRSPPSYLGRLKNERND